MAHPVAHKQAACANCHFTFGPNEPDEFCPRCGQQNHAVDLRLGHVLEEFLEGVFHFDGKVFRTAGLLLFQPGELTRRFLAGHRVAYVPPIRLYVFISFVFFLVLGWAAGHNAEQREHAAHSKATPAAHAEALPAPTGARAAVFSSKADSKGIYIGTDTTAFAIPLSNGGTISKAQLQQLPHDASRQQVDSLLRSKGEEPSFTKRLLVSRYLHWRDVSSEEVLHSTLRTASIMLFFLMPLAALLLKGAYWRRQAYYLGHLIFTVHLHCALFILLIVSTLLQLAGLDVVSDWLPFLILPYFLLALHRVYAQSWGKTLLKTLLLSGAYLVVLFLSVALAAVATLTLT